MASPPGDRVIGELVLERHVHRTREVTALVGAPPVGLAELPAHVQNRHRLTGGELPRQFRCGDKHLGTRIHPTMLPNA